MKLNEGLKILKKKYPEYIILVKNGLFYNAVGTDAIILSREFNLVKICFTKEVCKVGINENKIEDFTKKLIKENYKYIIYNYNKGDFKDIEEQFVEIERKDNGITFEKEKIKIDCLNCEYNKRKKQREKVNLPVNKICEIYKETDKIAKGKKEFIKIFNKKKELEQDLQNITKITNDYLNNLMDEYLMEEEDE